MGAIIGVLLVPAAQSLFEAELITVERSIEGLAPGELVGGAIGLTTGLVIAFLAKSVLFEFITFAGPTGGYIAIVLYLVISLFAAYLGARVGAKQRVTLGRIGGVAAARAPATGIPKIIDTSVIIDGRILEIVEAGFLEGPLVLPRFVLRELQLIADSGDSLKRTRGRRGLEVLTKLQQAATLEIVERDFDDIAQVDAKLVRLARERGGKLVTNDFNLNRVAHVEGVAVLNINELANAVKPVLLPGEELRVTVIKEGKEPHQGVGYLDDGTMIVIENGRRLIGETVEVSVTSALQTMAGRMIFARTKARMIWGAVIVAAGRGTRFGRPKQLVDLAGKPLVAWSVKTFAAMPEIVDLVVVTEVEFLDVMERAVTPFAGTLRLQVVHGGRPVRTACGWASPRSLTTVRGFLCTTARGRWSAHPRSAPACGWSGRAVRRCWPRRSSTPSRSSTRRAPSRARSTARRCGPRRRRSLPRRVICGACTPTPCA